MQLGSIPGITLSAGPFTGMNAKVSKTTTEVASTSQREIRKNTIRMFRPYRAYIRVMMRISIMSMNKGVLQSSK